MSGTGQLNKLGAGTLTLSGANPYIGFPYTKLMNANAFIDQAAAVIMTSVALLAERRVPVYLMVNDGAWRVSKFTHLLQGDEALLGDSDLGDLRALDVDGSGNVYAAGRSTNQVYRFSPSGEAVAVTNEAGFTSCGNCPTTGPATEAFTEKPFDVAVDSQGAV